MRVTDQKLECANICELGDKENTEFSLRAQYLTFNWETMLYLLKCRQEVQLATDWDTHVCFRELPVWLDAAKPHRKLCFLAPGSRLLLNSSQRESCIPDNHVPPGYQTISGEWVALTPELQLLRSPPEAAGTQAVGRDGSTRTRSHTGPYQEGTLFRWAEYHQNQFR